MKLITLIFLGFFIYHCNGPADLKSDSKEKIIITPKPSDIINLPPKIISMPVTTYDLGDPTGPAIEYDLTQWEVVQFINLVHGSWTVTTSTAKQTVNADASALLSDIDVAGKKIVGTWSVDEGAGDDDFIGFVFGYQNIGNFYLLDWKRQREPIVHGVAEKGISVKRITTGGAAIPPSTPVLWSTKFSDQSKSKLLATNTSDTNVKGWEFGKEYTFILDFIPGSFNIIIKDGESIVANFAVKDDAFSNGKFGFYNYSQARVNYKGFTHTPIVYDDYKYQVLAQDPENTPVQYQLITKPDLMTIDASTGLITWPKNSIVSGLHSISVKAIDAGGLSDIQNYALSVP